MLHTKLHRPPITKEHVYREHLIEFLNKNLYKPFTLVSAGAGYGKSMLISSWLEKSDISYAWVSLNEDDNDIRNFIAAISASIQEKFPKALKDVTDIFKAATLPSLSYMSEILINGLDDITKEFVLVLDDYHVIKNNDINKLINTLLQYPPQLMHLVILTRRDPLLDLHKLRAGNRINEFRMSELSFARDEIRVLFKSLINRNLNHETIESLYERTEGWIAGLHLYSLIMKDSSNAQKTINKIPANLPYITNYLVKEVFSNIKPDLQSKLIRVSILNRFCAELVDHIISDDQSVKDSNISGRAFIDWLSRSGLFIIPIDNRGEWFRYHHLWQELLQNQLLQQGSKEEINAYHGKASEWFDQKGLIEEAVKHAIKSENIGAAVNIILGMRFKLLETGQYHRLNNLIDLLPETITEKTPALLTTKSFIMEFRAHLAEWVDFKDKAKVLLKNGSMTNAELDKVRGEVAAIESTLLLISQNHKKASEKANTALDLLPVDSDYARSYGHVYASNVESQI